MSKTKQQDFLVQNIISEIVTYIMEDRRVKTDEALEIFFSSELSKKIEDIETEYYLESPSYIYEILKKEFNSK